jgi:hypothetical protein
MTALVVTSIGYVNFVKANPAPLGYPYPKIDWDCSNNTIFTNSNVNLEFNISFSDALLTYGWGGLQPNYTITTKIEGIYCKLDLELNKGDKSVPVSESESGTYFVNLTGLSKGTHTLDLAVDCRFNYSEQFNQDILKMDFDHQSHITTIYPFLAEPIYFTVQTNQESLSPMIVIGVGTSLAVIVAVALVVVYRKHSLKLKVNGDSIGKET